MPFAYLPGPSHPHGKPRGAAWRICSLGSGMCWRGSWACLGCDRHPDVCHRSAAAVQPALLHREGCIKNSTCKSQRKVRWMHSHQFCQHSLTLLPLPWKARGVSRWLIWASELYEEEGNFQFMDGNGRLWLPQSHFYNRHVTAATENTHYFWGS